MEEPLYTLNIPPGSYSFKIGDCRNLERVEGRTFVNNVDITEALPEIAELERLFKL